MAAVDGISAKGSHRGVADVRQEIVWEKNLEGDPYRGRLRCGSSVVVARPVGQGWYNGGTEGDPPVEESAWASVLSRRGQVKYGGKVYAFAYSGPRR